MQCTFFSVPDIAPVVRDVIPKSDSEAVVTWDLPPEEVTNGDVKEITVFILYERGEQGQVAVTEQYTEPGSSTNLTISNLQPRRRYEVMIQLTNNAGTGPFSARFSFTAGRNVYQMSVGHNIVFLTSFLQHRRLVIV